MDPAGNRRSTSFWEARAKSASRPAAEPERKETTRIRFISWDALVAAESPGSRAGPPVAAKVVGLSETGARLILPFAIERDARLELFLREPTSGETLEADLRVIWVTPPVADATTWIAGTEFADLGRSERQTIARWWMEYTSRERAGQA